MRCGTVGDARTDRVSKYTPTCCRGASSGGPVSWTTAVSLDWHCTERDTAGLWSVRQKVARVSVDLTSTVRSLMPSVNRSKVRCAEGQWSADVDRHYSLLLLLCQQQTVVARSFGLIPPASLRAVVVIRQYRVVCTIVVYSPASLLRTPVAHALSISASVLLRLCSPPPFLPFSSPRPSAMRCHQCGSSDVDVDPSRSDVVCMECGAVLSDVSIVSEVNFSEQPSGLSSVVGQFVSLSGSRGLSVSAKRGVGVGGVSSAGYGRDSREQTLSVGRKLLQQLSDALRLRPIHVDQAYGHFKLAVQHNFIQGRRTRYVAAACMYVACRKSKTPHLLLDLADALQVNLYMLGATLLKLLRLLHITLPIVDPSLYIHRFAAQLQLQPNQPLHAASTASQSSLQKELSRGSASTHMVAMTALRLVSRMKRDWLQVGRRPSGICGACLLIACRMHGYRRSHREILDVVRVCDSTLRRRLLEFVSTPSSALTFVEFEQQNAADEGVEPTAVLDDGHNPPAFTYSVQREQDVERAARRKQEVAAQLLAKGIVDADVERQWELEVSQLLQLPAFAALEDKQPVTLDADLSLRQLINEHCRGRDKHTDNSGGNSAAVKADSTDSAELVIALNADVSVDVDTVRQQLTNQRAAALRGDRAAAAEVKPRADDQSTLDPGQTALTTHQQQAAVSDLSHLDDAELDECILTEEEVAFRTRMWDDTHADYIKTQSDKRQNMEANANHAAIQHDTNSETPSNPADSGKGGRFGAGGGGGIAGGGAGGGGQSYSSSARKKAKLGQSAFFLSATSTQSPSGSGDSLHADSYSSVATSSSSAALAGGSSLTSDVSALLSGSDVASSASTAAAQFLSAASYAGRQSAVRQQQRRVSGKINYQRLKGLLDNNSNNQLHNHADNHSSEQHGTTHSASAQQQHSGASSAAAVAGSVAAKRRRSGVEEDDHGSERQSESGVAELDDEQAEEDGDEEEESEEHDADEVSAASLMRAERVDGGYGSLDDTHD